MALLQYTSGQLPLILYHTDISSYAPLKSFISRFGHLSSRSPGWPKAVNGFIRILGGRLFDGTTRFSNDPLCQNRILRLVAINGLMTPAPKNLGAILFPHRGRLTGTTEKKLSAEIDAGNISALIKIALAQRIDPHLSRVGDAALKCKVQQYTPRHPGWTHLPWGPFAELGPPLEGTPVCEGSPIVVPSNTLPLPLGCDVDWRNKDLSRLYVRLHGVVDMKSFGEWLLDLPKGKTSTYMREYGMHKFVIRCDANTILHADKTLNQRAKVVLSKIIGNPGMTFSDFVRQSWKAKNLLNLIVEGDKADSFLRDLIPGSVEWQALIRKKLFDKQTVFSADPQLDSSLRRQFVETELIEWQDVMKRKLRNSDLTNYVLASGEALTSVLLQLPKCSPDDWRILVNNKSFGAQTRFSNDYGVQSQLMSLYTGFEIVKRDELLSGKLIIRDCRSVRLETTEDLTNWLDRVKVGSSDWQMVIKNRVFPKGTIFSSQPAVQTRLEAKLVGLNLTVKNELLHGRTALFPFDQMVLEDGTLVADYLRRLTVGSADWLTLVANNQFTTATVFDSRSSTANRSLSDSFLGFRVIDISTVKDFFGTVHDYRRVYLGHGQLLEQYLKTLKPGTADWFDIMYGKQFMPGAVYSSDPTTNANIEKLLAGNFAYTEQEVGTIQPSILNGATCWIRKDGGGILTLEQYLLSTSITLVRRVMESQGNWRVLPLTEQLYIRTEDDLKIGIVHFEKNGRCWIGTLLDYLLTVKANYPALIESFVMKTSRSSEQYLRLGAGVYIGPDRKMSDSINSALNRLSNATFFTKEQWFSGGDYRGKDLSCYFIDGVPLESFLSTMTVGSREWRIMMHNCRFDDQNIRLGSTANARAIAKKYLEKYVRSNEEWIRRPDHPDLWIRFNGQLYSADEFARLPEAQSGSISLGEDPVSRAIAKGMARIWRSS